MPKNPASRWLKLLCAFALPLLVGCRGNVSAVSGDISFAGKPIESGSVRFFPVDGTEGTGAIAPISNGKFEIASDRGLIAGHYLVQVTAMKKTGRVIRPKEVMPGDDPAPQQEELQIIPTKYNTQSDLKVELTPGDNSYAQQLAP